MNRGVTILFVLAVVLTVCCGCNSKNTVVPAPDRYDSRSGKLVLKSGIGIAAPDELHRAAAARLATRLANLLGAAVPVSTNSYVGAVPLIAFQTSVELSPEHYLLSIGPGGVQVRASDLAGFQYAVETFFQLLPPSAYGTNRAPSPTCEVGACEISDGPRFAWRGLMLDVSRHFFNSGEVRRVLDLMAMHKLNKFHWHLTDDEGWRLEIRRFPALTDVGGWREGVGFGLDPKSTRAYGTNGLYGGFYSRAEAADIVRYAASLNIEVIPEVEMPSHAGAALRAFPELLCEGVPYAPETGQGLIPTVFCAGNEKTFEFLERVIAEVAELFPGRYIHIGGDEVPKRNWSQCPRCQERMRALHLRNVHELQAWFMTRVAGVVTACGRTPIVWGEKPVILPPGSVLMDWAGGAVEAATAGHGAIVTPSEYTYLNMYQSRDRSSEPKAIGGLVTLEKAYSFEPLPKGLDPCFRHRIVGPQACLWTEYIASMEVAEYMLFPRLCAVAEVGWSPPQRRHWRDFQRRLQTHQERLDSLGVNSFSQ